MIYEKHADGRLDTDRHWWVQAETVVGMLYLWKHHGMDEMQEKACHTWDYIKHHLVDHRDGEWHWSILGDGEIDVKDDKAGFWKCPYHNSRMHLEALLLMGFKPMV